jgi:PAS domain S-box-containing protein
MESPPIDILIDKIKALREEVTSSAIGKKIKAYNSDLFRPLLESDLVGIVIHGADSSIIEANQKAAEILRIKPDDIQDKKVDDKCWKFLDNKNNIINSDKYPVTQILTTGVAIENRIYGILHLPLNEKTWVIVNGFPVKDENGVITEVVIGFINISDDGAKMNFKQELLERITDAFVAIDSDWNYTYVNKVAGVILNRDPDKLVGKNIWKEFPEGVGQPFYNAYYQAKETQKFIYLEEYYAPYNRWFENYIYPSPNGISIIFRDITGRKTAKEKILKANRLYLLISELNQAIIRSANVNALFQEVCNVALISGDYKMAWIGLADDKSEKVYPKASAGDDAGFLTSIKKVSLQNVTEGNGPVGRSVREGTHIVINDIENDPHIALWRTEALNRGYQSTIAVPIFKFGKVIGAFALYSSKKNYFDEEERILLTKCVENISYALEKFHIEELQRETEQIVKESQKRYKTLADYSTVGIFHTDMEGKTTFVNPFWSEISGLSYNDALENGWFKAVHPEDIEMLQKGWKDTIKNGKFSSTEYRFLRPDKTVRYVLGQAIPERDDNNNIIGYVGTITDITERKLAEAKNEKEKVDSTALINSTSDLLWAVSKDLKMINANNAFISGLKYNGGVTLKPGDDILTKGAFPDEYLNYWKEFYLRGLSGEVFMEEISTPQANSIEPLWFELKMEPIFTSTEITGVACYMRNITERKKTDSALKESEEHYRTLMENAPDPMVVLDMESGKFIEASRTALALFKMTKSEFLTKKVIDVSATVQRDGRISSEGIEENLAGALKGDKPFFEWLHIDKDGNQILCEVTLVRLPSVKRKLVCGSLTDITERSKKSQHLKLLESVITNANDAVLITEAEPIDGPNPKIIYVNKAFTDMTGYTSEEVIGQTPRILQGPKTDKKELEKLKNAMKQWKPCEITVVNYKKNGEEFWINFSISPVADEKGWYTHWISIDKDVTRQKQEEQLLKDSEERLRLSLYAAKQGLYDLNVQSGEAIVNDQYALMLGYSPETFVETNENWIKRLHPDDLAVTQQAYLNYIAGKTDKYEVEFRQKTKDNNWKWILSLGKIVEYSPDGKPLRLLGTHTDITERKNAEQALLQAERRLHFLVSSTPAVIYSSQVEYPYAATFISENIIDQTGYLPEEFLNDFNFWANNIHPDDKQRVEEDLHHVFINKKMNHEYRFKIKDGSYIWMYDEMRLVTDETGRPLEMVGYWIVIDERKKAEEAFAISENHLRVIYNTEPECIKLLGPNGELQDMNPAGLTMIEADSLEEVKGVSVLNIINKPYRAAFIKLTSDVFNGKSGKLIFEITGLKGATRWMETHAVPLRNKNKEIVSLLGVTRDISEQRNAEEEIKKSQLELRSLAARLQEIREEEGTRIAREIHDELGQQLTGLKMAAVWIKKKTEDKNKEALREKVENMIGIIDDTIKSVKRISSDLRPGVLDDLGLIAALEWQSGEFEKRTEIKCNFKSSRHDLEMGKDVSSGVFRIYQEALTNIARHAHAEKVETSFDFENDNITLTVKDNGCGFNTSESVKLNTFGILGMKERALMLNGELIVRSERNKGTALVLKIPIKKSKV